MSGYAANYLNTGQTQATTGWGSVASAPVAAPVAAPEDARGCSHATAELVAARRALALASGWRSGGT